MKSILATYNRRKTEDAGRSRQSISVFLIASLLAVSYASSASSESEDIYLNPVIFIPGTMGSRLVDRETKDVIWGRIFLKGPVKKNEMVKKGMALPMVQGGRLYKIHDSVKEDGVLRDLQLSLLPGVKFNAGYYHAFIDEISGKPEPQKGKKRLSRDASPKRICCEFGYDWRRSCDENTALLAAFIEKEKRIIEAKRRAAGNAEPVRFDIVAHSQGALLARYYLRYGDQIIGTDGSLPELNWAGASHVDNVVLLAAPNRGLALAMTYLTVGRKPHNLIPFYGPAVLGTMPSLYQLLPRASDNVLVDDVTGEALDPLDFDLWVKKEWGLANPKLDRKLAKILPHAKTSKERRAIALDHLRKCLVSAQQVQASLDRTASRPRHLRMALCASSSKKTPARMSAHRHKVEFDLKLPGDGTVALYSASDCPSPVNRGNRLIPSWDIFRLFDTDHSGLGTEPGEPGFFLKVLSSR